MPDNTVEIGPRSVTLKAPRSLALRHEVVAYAATNPHRAFAAALGICWQSVGRPKTQYAGCQHSPGIYGGRVIDELLAHDGVTYADIVSAGADAWIYLNESLPTETEVAAAADFTDAQPAASTGLS